ncbi:MAG: biopolymer transporter ExbD [Prevotella sp.]|nr:biopolymer transporter ExbD [Prevotella sp.]
MIKFRKQTRRSVPMLNTASLPDLIFTVLFFFMIVTHMRNESAKVDLEKPQGTELTRLAKKSSVTYIYIGTNGQVDEEGRAKYLIQVNDKIVDIENLTDYIIAERSRMSLQDREQATVSLKADKQTPMHIITEVKRCLRQAKAYRISYSGESKR